ncbi:hypothetical protein B0H63DRAFT_486391 [Podospora didyma]|uniref:FAD-binding FR-type domain-containing protein n=1 Tax=Podospora didyma TaxID=330526 RepID=A0AAE0N473_9PEZI|nr:hypothetical protein B0H63DRAFT_486391 [Podospora didyma]
MTWNLCFSAVRWLPTRTALVATTTPVHAASPAARVCLWIGIRQFSQANTKHGASPAFEILPLQLSLLRSRSRAATAHPSTFSSSPSAVICAVRTFTSTRETKNPHDNNDGMAIQRVMDRKGTREDGGFKEPSRKAGFPVRVPVAITLTVLVLSLLSFVFIPDELYYSLVGWPPLNEHSFVPFTIISREQVSPTSFILTVEPKGRAHPAHPSNESVIKGGWDYGLWSVEIKQPQLQVAREYTPLPSLHGEEKEDIAHARLRFLVRKVNNGEVSSYLSRLAVGDEVELRGPHLGFDVRARLGDGQHVVFLAGGTGIAPALQAVRALQLETTEPKTTTTPSTTPRSSRRPSISILWANRHWADCSGAGDTIPALSALTMYNSNNREEEARYITSYLACAAAQTQRSEDNNNPLLTWECTVDEEGTFITPSKIANAMMAPSSSSQNATTLQGRRANNNNHNKSITSSEKCALHSSKLLVSNTGKDVTSSTLTPLHAVRGGGPSQKCLCIDEKSGQHVPGGKNLLMISGPEGFVEAYAGAKVWGPSGEQQGPVRGIIADLAAKKGSPSSSVVWKDWLVLKL